MLRQALALLLLKWAMTRNSWLRGQVLDSLTGIATISFAIMGACGLGVLCFFIGFLLPAEHLPFNVPLAIADMLVAGYLFIVVMGIVSDLQASETIDFKKMLYLPVSLKMVFLMNMTASLATPSVCCFALAISGFVMGLAFALGPRMIAGFALIACFLWMVAAWLHFLRSWLSVVLESKRRRRTVAAIAVLAVVLLCQMPNMAGMLFRKCNGAHFAQQLGPWLSLEGVNRAIPFGWLPLGLHHLNSGSYAAALLLAASMFAVGLFGVLLGYRATLRFHAGGGSKGVVAEGRKERPYDPKKRKVPLTMRSLPWVGEEASAVAFASFLSFIRHPQLRMQFISSSIMMIFVFLPMYFSMSSLSRGNSGAVETFRHFAAFGAVAFPYFGTLLTLHNMFGIDISGFRAYVLSPLDRRQILLGKNLAALPCALLASLVFLLLAVLLLGVGVCDAILALFAAGQLFLLQAALGNFMSQFLAFPCRFDEAIRSKKRTNRQILGGLAGLLSMPIAIVPAGACFAGGIALTAFFGLLGFCGAFALSSLGLAIAALIYKLSLDFGGRLLMRREASILLTLTAER